MHFTLPQCLYNCALYLTSVPVQGCTLPYLSPCTRVHFSFLPFIFYLPFILYFSPHKTQGADVLLNDYELFVHKIVSTYIGQLAKCRIFFFWHEIIISELEVKFAFIV